MNKRKKVAMRKHRAVEKKHRDKRKAQAAAAPATPAAPAAKQRG